MKGKRVYIRGSMAWYHNSLNKTIITICVHNEEDRSIGEFDIEWVNLNGRECARIKVWEDGWDALWEFQDLLEKMAEVAGDCITEPEFAKILDELGIEDVTEYRMKDKGKTILEKYNDYRSGSKQFSKDELKTFEVVKNLENRKGLGDEWD